MKIDSFTTEELKKELQRRASHPGVWSVVKYLRDDTVSRYGRSGEPKHIHLIEDIDGNQMDVQLVGNIYDKYLNKAQPSCSDEDPNWDNDWEAYEEYSIQYFIGKKVQIDSFDPLKISKIL
jgi:hypothetical protein